MIVRRKPWNVQKEKKAILLSFLRVMDTILPFTEILSIIRSSKRNVILSLPVLLLFGMKLIAYTHIMYRVVHFDQLHSLSLCFALHSAVSCAFCLRFRVCSHTDFLTLNWASLLQVCKMYEEQEEMKYLNKGIELGNWVYLNEQRNHTGLCFLLLNIGSC